VLKVEKKILRHYNRCFLAEIGAYALFGTTVAYGILGAFTGRMNPKIVTYFLAPPGLSLSIGTFYLRHGTTWKLEE